MKKLQLIAVFALGISMCFASPDAPADEGMWLFSNPPKQQLKEHYDFEPSERWLKNLQQSAVRFNNGGSGAFVSPDGLVITNHHVGADALQKLSTPDRDLVAAGFYAKTRDEEIKCVDLELNVLMSTEDVTSRVNAAVKPDMSQADAQKARRAVMNTIEEESLKTTKMRSDVVTLYHGGRYHLYRYKKYTDVRLVFAPEQSIAFFGGDPDNFEYPRYDLDICFFHVYEGGKPVKVEHYLPWSKSGAGENELVFVAGNPGHTDRLDTVHHLDFLRDRVYPSALRTIFRREVLLRAYSQRSLENARRAKEELFGLQNSRKARLGALAGLQDPSIMNRKQKDEKGLREAVAKRADLKGAANAWDDVSAAVDEWNSIYRDWALLEVGTAFNSKLFSMARELVRMAEEDKKPNADRLREYRQSNRESLEQQLFSKAPIYDDLETAKLSDSLSMFMEEAGDDNQWVRKTLQGHSPQDRANELVRDTRLKDVVYRKQLAKAGRSAIEGCKDPMIQLARLVDPPSREVRKTYEEKVDEPMKQAYAKIANARFTIEGTSTYPDATFTLRLAFGQVKGYTQDGKSIPPWTTIGGAFKHSDLHGHKPPFALPQSWLHPLKRLKLDTPFNFVCTADIIGGNSGSPVVNKAGEYVGIIFDGNIQSLVLDFTYTDKKARAVSVHSSAILEALRKVYGADALVDEIERGRRK
ncbi:MAG TPA: S46 family peptidase [Lacipirellulaceae bacterium]|nr:S46 family peptidase [Lacipirellulaceae bacterium]